MVDEYESASDYLALILDLRMKLCPDGHGIAEADRNELLDLHKHVHEYITLINKAVHADNADVMSKVRVRGDAISHMAKEARAAHLERQRSEELPPADSLVFTDMLTAYRRLKEHMINIAEALAGAK